MIPPEWIRVRYPSSNTNQKTIQFLDDLKLHTVCQGARWGMK